MEIATFFNSVNGDRKYKAEDWAAQLTSIFTSGILANPASNLKVEAHSGMVIKVNAGKGWINGYFYWNQDDLIIDVPTADGALKRIDSIVLRWSLADRTIRAVLKQGTPASLPTAPALQRDAEIYELQLATIAVAKGAIAITQQDSADTRYLTDVCGKVAPLFGELDLSDFYAECGRNMAMQINAWEEQTAAQQATWAAGLASQKSEYDTLFAEMQALYGGLSTQTFNLINNNFDDWSVKRGCSKTTVFGKTITETITVTATGFTLATRETTFGESITEVISFYPWETTESGNTINSTTFTMTKTTTFNSDGTITEVAL